MVATKVQPLLRSHHPIIASRHLASIVIQLASSLPLRLGLTPVMAFPVIVWRQRSIPVLAVLCLAWQADHCEWGKHGRRKC